MKNKILLGSVTLLSALMVAACGNGEKKATETAAAPTTEVTKETTVAPTTTAQTTTPGSSSTKEISLADTQRVGNETLGYVNVPKDWVVLKDPNNAETFQYSSTDKYNILYLSSYSKDKVKLNDGETFGAELIANRIFSNLKSDKDQTSLQGVRADFAGEKAYLIKATFSDGKTMFEWILQKGDKVYLVAIEGTEEMVKSLRPVLEQSWGLDSKTPGQ
mgnify:FL=1